MKALLLLLGLLASADALALPQESRVPGGLALLPLPSSLPPGVQARFEDKPVFIGQVEDGRQAVVGIPLAASAGEARLVLTAAGSQQVLATLPFTIHPKDYPEQRITLRDDTHVHPSPEALARYDREAREQQAAYRVFSTLTTRWPAFIPPTKGDINPSFGRKRFFNGEPRAPHLGMDIAAPPGQRVVAPAEGVVLRTGDYFFNGKTVMIDHGQGLVSMLCHLSKINVKEGARLRRGDPVGLVGKTGRATGPHLHWTVSLNDTRIDPLLVLPPVPVAP